MYTYLSPRKIRGDITLLQICFLSLNFGNTHKIKHNDRKPSKIHDIQKRVMLSQNEKSLILVS